MNEAVREIILEEIDKHGLIFYDIEYQKEGLDWYLRIIVDKDCEGGVSLQDLLPLNDVLCERITDDMMDKAYIMEVCSPGAERKLRNLEEVNKYLGSYVYVKTYEKIEGLKEFYGNIVSVDGEVITIELDKKKKMSIEYSKMSTIRLAIKF